MVATQASPHYFLFVFYDFMGVSVGVARGTSLFRSLLSRPGC